MPSVHLLVETTAANTVTGAKTKQVGGRREGDEGSALFVRDPIRPTEDAAMRRFAASALRHLKT
jgi:hypothetical protein